MARIAVAFFAFVLGACASTPAPVSELPAPVEVAPELAPFPFTAQEIQGAMKVGTLIKLRMDNGDATTLEEWVVIDANNEDCTIASKVFDLAGVLLEDQGTGTSAWEELRDHASFPAAHTQRSEVSIETPLGRLDAWLYVVSQTDEEGRQQVAHMHFAKTLPGPPVLMVLESDGKEVARMTMIERR